MFIRTFRIHRGLRLIERTPRERCVVVVRMHGETGIALSLHNGEATQAITDRNNR